MRRIALLAAAGLVLTSAPAAAQSWGGTWESGYSYGHRGDRNAPPSAFNWRDQLDRPGDYRCDAFWDASRIDCGAGWRDQRRRVSSQARGDYRDLVGHWAGYGAGHGHDSYGYGHDRYDRYRYDDGYGHAGYSGRSRGYGSDHGGRDQGGAAYYGAYGRPDLVYPAGGRGHDPRASSGSRADWCRANYRSYNPYTGYYRAYSGRLIHCG